MLDDNREYRYELKYVMKKSDAEQLKKDLQKIMRLDPNSVSEECSYRIRSLYFDNPLNEAFYEKNDGIEFRKKYRLRMYNDNSEFLRMECKHKDGNWTYKEDCKIDKSTADLILKNKLNAIKSDNEFLKRFISETKIKGLKPSVIVDYNRLAFVYPVSNVRITFDEDLHSGRNNVDFFNKKGNTVPVFPDQQLVLEVKCDRFIPDHILSIIASYPKIRQAVSKFALCKGV